MPEPINEKQQVILDFLKSEIREKGFPPSIREICKITGLRSTSTIHSHLEALEKAGYIYRSPSKNRSIEIKEDNFYTPMRCAVSVPILSRIAESENIIADDNIEGYFPVTADVVNDDICFIIKVLGDSMTNAGILHNDMALIKKTKQVNSGDIAAALIDGAATVKTYYKEDDYIRLQPESPFFDPIITKDVVILGKVIGIFRFSSVKSHAKV